MLSSSTTGLLAAIQIERQGLSAPKSSIQQVCIQPHTSAVDKTLLAFAAECHAAALCCGACGAISAGRLEPTTVDRISCSHSGQ